MEIRLEPDGLKLTLPPDDMRLVERFFPFVRAQVMMSLTTALRIMVAVATLGEEKITELALQYIEDGFTPEATARLAAALLGPQAFERLSSMVQEVTDEDRRNLWHPDEGEEEGG